MKLFRLTKFIQLVAISNNEVWYESSAGTMEEIADATGDINTNLPLEAVEAYQKIFIVNRSNLKILDLKNVKVSTDDAGANPCTKGMILTGGTSNAEMVVDYADGVTDDAAANIYGIRTTTQTFSSGETVTGTNADGNAVSFVTSAAADAPNHWYDWTVFGQDTTNYGTMPESSTLISLYRGRLVVNDVKRPHAWYMSKVGDPFKFLYDFTNDGDISAINYSQSRVGRIGDVLTCFIPISDDLFVFGCANSLWVLVGDPLSQGQIIKLTDTTGVWGSRSYCLTNDNLYFLGNDGIYKCDISINGVSKPVNISKLRLPNLMSGLDLDKENHRVVLGYDIDKHGILINKTTLDGGSNSNYWFSLTTEGFFPETYPNSCGVFSSYYYPATDDTYKKFLIGCQDGYIREFSNTTKNDATTTSTSAISSYCLCLQRLGQDDDSEGLVRSLTAVTAGGAADGTFSDTDSLSYSLYKGTDPEVVLEDVIDGADAAVTGSWSGVGKKNRVRCRLRGHWAGVYLYNSAASETWALNSLGADLIPKGKV